MARIRSIKPELWSDKKIAGLSHGCALFFIGMWNFCDDEGKCENDARQLSLRMPIFRSKDILTWLRTLSQTGLTQVSECSQWVLVTNWKHQKIDKPRLPNVKREDIQWLPIGHSTKPREKSTTVRRKDRIGKDRIGSGSDGLPAAQAPTTPPVNIVLNSEIWKSYCDAYFLRYNTEPVRNAKINGQVAQLAKRLGAEAPDVARFFVGHNKSYYVTKLHEFGACLQDAESLRTQWATGNKVTTKQAIQADEAQTLNSQLKRIREGKL